MKTTTRIVCTNDIARILAACPADVRDTIAAAYTSQRRMNDALEQLGATQADTAYLRQRTAAMQVEREAREFIEQRRSDRRRRDERRFKATRHQFI